MSPCSRSTPGREPPSPVVPAPANHSRQRPFLVGPAMARPNDQLGAIRGRPAGRVEAFTRLRIDEGSVRLRAPVLRSGAIAGPELDAGAVRGAAAGDVHALVQCLQR